jgi:C1A family cysteine protease
MLRRYNWKRDKEDPRDFQYKLCVQKPIALPPAVDLRKNCSPIEDQMTLGSCSGHALAGAFEYLELKEMREKTVAAEIFNANTFSTVSRLFIYYNERLIEGTVNEDSGATIRDGIKSLATYGACRESLWQYSENLAFTKPNEAAYLEASKHKISLYMRIHTLNDMKHCLADGYPFVFGFMVYPYMESEKMAKTGQLIVPGRDEECLGGHAVTCCGYDDKSQNFIIRNSWGVNWGLKGYFLMPYSYITDPDLASDFWAIRK